MKTGSLTFVLLLTLGTSTGYAADLLGSRFTFGAFGTLGAVYQNARGLAYRRSMSQGDGARAGEVDLGTDSLLGLQVIGRMTSHLEAQVQTVVRRNAHGLWRPTLARAFARFRPSPSLMVRAGRIGLGVYLLADALDVGYSYLTIRPPPEVYGLLASDDFDGLDATFTRRLGEGIARIRLLGGRLPYEIAFANRSIASLGNSKIFGVTADYLYRNWQTRVAFVATRQSGGADPITAALAQTGVPQAVALAGELSRSPENSFGFEVGALYDGDPLQGALVLVHDNSNFPQGPRFSGGLAQVGYRIARFTPYAAFAMTDSYAEPQSTGLPPLPVFEPLIAAAQQEQTAFATTQRDFSLGVRYDFTLNMDIKAQIDRVWLHQSALIFDYNVPPPGHTSLTVFGLALDFAF